MRRMISLWFLSNVHLYEVDDPAIESCFHSRKTLSSLSHSYQIVCHLNHICPISHHYSWWHISIVNLVSHLGCVQHIRNHKYFSHISQLKCQTLILCSLKIWLLLLFYSSFSFVWRWFVNWFKTFQYSRLGIGFYHQGPGECRGATLSPFHLLFIS